MKREDISHAIGLINDKHIQEAEWYWQQSISFDNKPISVKKIMAWVASIALVLTLSVPVLAAANVEAAYELLYAVSPEIAQGLKPVNRFSLNNGIKMEVISAHIYGDSAEIYLSMQDLKGQRIDETTDLFDSYHINSPFSSSATCERISVDAQTSTATFLVRITQSGQKEIKGKKITFSVDHFLSNKQEFHDKIDQIDMSAINRSPQIQTEVNLRGWSYNGAKSEKPEYKGYLQAKAEDAFSPVDGVIITGLGFIADKLHVQAYYQNILETDNHGYIYLVTPNGDTIRSEASIAFWDSQRMGSYEEYVFDLSPDETNRFALHGHFWTSNVLIQGDWQVTFPIQ